MRETEGLSLSISVTHCIQFLPLREILHLSAHHSRNNVHVHSNQVSASQSSKNSIIQGVHRNWKKINIITSALLQDLVFLGRDCKFNPHVKQVTE